MVETGFESRKTSVASLAIGFKSRRVHSSHFVRFVSSIYSLARVSPAEPILLVSMAVQMSI